MKAADIVGLYLDPPWNAIILSLDEKPSIQAIERATGYVETDSGAVVRALKSTYKRHGTLNLFAVLDVGTGPSASENDGVHEAGPTSNPFSGVCGWRCRRTKKST